jgi:Protein of unknown function (DUF3037)
MAHSFKFAVIRLSPDSLRGEAVNLGIAVFRDGNIETHTGRILTKARSLVPEFSSSLLEKSLNILRRFASVDMPVEEKHRAISSLGLIRLGELGSFESVDIDGDDYRENIRFLLSTFVSEPRSTRGPSIEANKRLATDIKAVFRLEGLLANEKDQNAISQHKIVPNWALPQRPNLQLDLAVKNGSLRVCEILELDFEDGGKLPANFFESAVKLKTACDVAQATETVFAYKARGPKSQIDDALELANSYSTRLLNWEVQSERRKFIQDWTDAATAH